MRYASCKYLPYRWSRDLGASVLLQKKKTLLFVVSITEERGQKDETRWLGWFCSFRPQSGKKTCPCDLCLYQLLAIRKKTVPPPCAGSGLPPWPSALAASLSKYLRTYMDYR